MKCIFLFSRLLAGSLAITTRLQAQENGATTKIDIWPKYEAGNASIVNMHKAGLEDGSSLPGSKRRRANSTCQLTA
jgi:hypothetical protein